MSVRTIRVPLNGIDRHYSYQIPGIRASYKDMTNSNSLFTTRDEWSVLGNRHIDVNQFDDIALTVIQNPTPFGYYTKTSSFLMPMTENGQPSQRAPTTENQSIYHVNQRDVAMSSALPLDNTVFAKQPNYSVAADMNFDPKMPNMKRTYVPDMTHSGFNPGQFLTPELDMTNRLNPGDVKRRKLRHGMVIPYRQDPAKNYNAPAVASQDSVGNWILDIPNAKKAM
jgi:hypothetical protein